MEKFSLFSPCFILLVKPHFACLINNCDYLLARANAFPKYRIIIGSYWYLVTQKMVHCPSHRKRSGSDPELLLVHSTDPERSSGPLDQGGPIPSVYLPSSASFRRYPCTSHLEYRLSSCSLFALHFQTDSEIKLFTNRHYSGNSISIFFFQSTS